MLLVRAGRLLGFVLASMLVATAACDDGDTASGPRLRRTPPTAGTPGDHDANDLEGANAIDTGNPNAETPPAAPPSPGTESAELAVSLPNATPTLGLGEELDVDVVVTPKNGFTGTVALTVTGLPAGVTASPTDVTVASGPATAKVKLSASYDAVVSAPDTSSPLVFTASAGGGTATANASFKVAPRMKLVIPVNVDALRAASVTYRDEWGSAFGKTPTALRTQPGNGIVVTVFNADSKSHVVHGAGDFPHGDTKAPIQPNALEMQNDAPRTRTLDVGADVSGYPHDGVDGSGASFRIKVEAAP